MKSKKSIVLLENEFQVRDFIEQFRDKNVKIIALSPFAMYELEKHDIPYDILEKYYNPQDLYELGINNFQKVENICTIIDSFLQKVFPVLAKIDFKPALYNMHSIKNIYDAVTIRLFQMSKLIGKENPKTLLIYDSRERPFDKTKLFLPKFDNQVSIYAKILTSFYKERTIVMPEISYKAEYKKSITDKFIEKIRKYITFRWGLQLGIL
jgi:hypothetical protein